MCILTIDQFLAQSLASWGGYPSHVSQVQSHLQIAAMLLASDQLARLHCLH